MAFLQDLRYAVRLLGAARPGPGGVSVLDGGAERLLRWDGIEKVLAAEVGEPQGVRTVVFDLVQRRGPEGGFEVLRLDAEPGEPAIELARLLSRVLPAERLGASIKSLAREGVAGEWYADLGAFEEAALDSLLQNRI